MPDRKDKSPDSGLSRRGFLKGVGAGTAAAGLYRAADGPDEAAVAAEQAVKGPGEIAVTLNINGKDQKVNVEPRATLLDTLRNRLDLTGSKKVCDRGTCGACTVLVDGEPSYSCSLLAVEAEGRKIRTIESIGTPEKMSKIQAAFVEHDAQQCGFCTPGFVVACTAFVEQNPNASVEEIREGLGGNLCRCGTYAGIIDAIASVTKGGA